MNRQALLRALRALSDELDRRGVRAKLFVVGGAAMALAYSRKRLTKDIDALFEPKTTVYEAARVVAEEMGLPQDWLNDAAKSFAPGDDPESRIVFSTPSLEASAASPKYLLAMKIFSARVSNDADDIKVLYKELGFTKAEEGLDLVEEMYPTATISPKAQFLLEEMFGPIGREDAPPSGVLRPRSARSTKPPRL